jgi:hypothetical protein
MPAGGDVDELVKEVGKACVVLIGVAVLVVVGLAALAGKYLL